MEMKDGGEGLINLDNPFIRKRSKKVSQFLRNQVFQSI
jgi:hypothetical protein